MARSDWSATGGFGICNVERLALWSILARALAQPLASAALAGLGTSPPKPRLSAWLALALGGARQNRKKEAPSCNSVRLLKFRL